MSQEREISFIERIIIKDNLDKIKSMVQKVKGKATLRTDSVMARFKKESGNLTIDTFVNLSKLIKGDSHIANEGLDSLALDYAKFCIQLGEGKAYFPIFSQELYIGNVPYSLESRLVFNKKSQNVSVDFNLFDTNNEKISEISVYLNNNFAVEKKCHDLDILAHHIEKETAESCDIMNRCQELVAFVVKQEYRRFKMSSQDISKYTMMPVQFVMDNFFFIKENINFVGDNEAKVNAIDYILGTSSGELQITHRVNPEMTIVDKLREINSGISNDDAINVALNLFFSGDEKYWQNKLLLAKVQAVLT